MSNVHHQAISVCTWQPEPTSRSSKTYSFIGLKFFVAVNMRTCASWITWNLLTQLRAQSRLHVSSSPLQKLCSMYHMYSSSAFVHIQILLMLYQMSTIYEACIDFAFDTLSITLSSPWCYMNVHIFITLHIFWHYCIHTGTELVICMPSLWFGYDL